MKRRRHQHVSKEDGLTLSQRNTLLKKKKTSTTGRHDNSERIPIDLIIEILWRLPLKSIARCRCVSKFWASTLRLPCFTELYLTRSSSRPQLFFSCYQSGSVSLHLVSAPQVQNTSLVAASYHKKFPFNDSYGNAGSFDHLRGLTCHSNVWNLNGRKENETVSMIYNPSTRECLNLPKVKTRNDYVRSFLGYDPINNKFKVLSMTWGYCKRHRFFEEIRVLTLGKTNWWRRIECCVPHCARGKAICIDGGLYYHASLANELYGDATIVWFDVRYEKFRFINVIKNPYNSTLVNYKGKLGLFMCDVNGVTGENRCFELWVLVDADKHEWSKHVFVLPSWWKNVVGAYRRLVFAGVIAGTNEIVLAPTNLFRDSFYIYYYDFERETIRRVGIEGNDMVIQSPPYPRVETFLDHLEDVKLLKMF